jgi:putative membrane protein
MMHWWGSGYGMGLGGSIVMILFWVLLFLGIIYLGKMLMGGGSEADKPRETAREVLEKRFAGGEISREEFEEAMEVLKRNQACNFKPVKQH